MQVKKITCIALDGEFPDFTSHLLAPDYGMPLIATILSKAGYDVRVYIEHIKPPEWDRISDSDLVCFSTWNANAEKTYRLAQEIRKRLAITIVIGGVHASYFPESCLRHCDYVVFGEGDETILELVEALALGGEVDKVPGIAYRVGDQVRRTASRSGPPRFDTIPMFSLIEGYRRLNILNILVERKTPVLTAQYSRGCPFKCTFCIVNTMFPGGYRTRDIEMVIRDLQDKRQYGRHLLFVDNEFAGDRAHAKQLLRRIIEEDFRFHLAVFARVDVAKDDELLSLMRQAGITYIFQGYESVQPETLIAYNKHQTLTEMIAAIEKLHYFGIGMWGSFVLGADTDTLETIKSTVNFALEHKISTVYFWPIWGHFPEDRSGYQTIVPWYRGIFRGWRHCNGHFVTHFPLNIPPSKLQTAIIDAYRAVYSPKQIFQALKDRRFNDVRSRILHRYQWGEIEKDVQSYVPFLEELEEGLYDSKGHLCEEVLIKRVTVDPQWTFPAGNLKADFFSSGLTYPAMTG
jgi:anaerobic magnesium-protoporphyrin IX monomethyl ester cyclase